MALSIREIKWVMSILQETGCEVHLATIFSDNQGAIRIMKAEASSGRTKHLDIKLQFLKQAVLSGDIKIRYINTSDNISDIFTKPLSRLPFRKLSDLLYQ